MPRRSRGFTLVEVMTVMVVISLLAAILVPNFHHARAQSHLSACISNLSSMGRALQMYSVDNDGQYPTTTSILVPQFLSKLPTCPSQQGTYVVDIQQQPDASYTVRCSGLNHSMVGYPDDFPQYSASAGLILP